MFLGLPMARQVWDEETCDTPEPGCVCFNCQQYVASFETGTPDTEPAPSLSYTVTDSDDWDFTTFAGKATLPTLSSGEIRWTVPFQETPEPTTIKVQAELWGDFNDFETLNAGGVFAANGWSVYAGVQSGDLVIFAFGGAADPDAPGNRYSSSISLKETLEDLDPGNVPDPPLTLTMTITDICEGRARVRAHLWVGSSEESASFSLPLELDIGANVTPADPSTATIEMGIWAPSDTGGNDPDECCPDFNRPDAWKIDETYGPFDENSGTIQIVGTLSWDPDDERWEGTITWVVECPGAGQQVTEHEDATIECDGTDYIFRSDSMLGGGPSITLTKTCDVSLTGPFGWADCFANFQDLTLVFKPSVLVLPDPRQFDNVKMSACGGIVPGECPPPPPPPPLPPGTDPQAWAGCLSFGGEQLWVDDLVPTFASVSGVVGFTNGICSDCESFADFLSECFGGTIPLVLGQWADSLPDELDLSVPPRFWRNMLCGEFGASCEWTSATFRRSTGGHTSVAPLVTLRCGEDFSCSSGPSDISPEAFWPSLASVSVGYGKQNPLDPMSPDGRVVSVSIAIGGGSVSYRGWQADPLTASSSIVCAQVSDGTGGRCGGIPASVTVTFGAVPPTLPSTGC